VTEKVEGMASAVEDSAPKYAPTTRRAKSVYREVIETILLTVVIFLAVRGVVQNFKVEGYSMEPSLHSGQYLLVNKAVYFRYDPKSLQNLFSSETDSNRTSVYLFHPPQRGDVVVFEYPQDPSRDFIKRVVALPGEQVEIRQGRVYVDGIALEEPYLMDAPAYNLSPIEVPESTVFVLGDNRNNSSDSHVWGVLPVDNIIGEAWICYWPPKAWGLLPNYSFEKTSS
jgi:signal peptidase I